MPRRGHSRHDGPTRVGELLIDPARRKVMVGDREVHLAKKAFTACFASSPPTYMGAAIGFVHPTGGCRGPR